MAFANSVIAQRFVAAFVDPTVKRRAAQGSNLFFLPIYDINHSQRLTKFETVAMLKSYDTDIATVQFNHNTIKTELWLADVRYSPTTDRHMSELRKALRDYNREVHQTKGEEGCNEVESRIYRHVVRPANNDRDSHGQRERLFMNTRARLHTVNKPHIHIGTRADSLSAAGYLAKQFVKHIETGFNAREQELLYVVDTAKAAAKTSMEEARAVVAAYFALSVDD